MATNRAAAVNLIMIYPFVGASLHALRPGIGKVAFPATVCTRWIGAPAAKASFTGSHSSVVRRSACYRDDMQRRRFHPDGSGNVGGHPVATMTAREGTRSANTRVRAVCSPVTPFTRGSITTMSRSPRGRRAIGNGSGGTNPGIKLVSKTAYSEPPTFTRPLFKICAGSLYDYSIKTIWT